MTTMPDPPAPFEHQARQAYAVALDRLSPQTLARLRAARHATLKPARTPRFGRWGLATACSLALLLVAGLQWMPSPTPDTPQAAATVEDADDPYAALDESPELYVWLGSDAQTLALE